MSGLQCIVCGEDAVSSVGSQHYCVKHWKIIRLLDSTLQELCDLLDSELYVPIKQELAQFSILHSLGYKKEMYKIEMERVFKKLKEEILEGIKSIR